METNTGVNLTDNMTSHEAPRVTLSPSIEKILEAISFVIAEAERRNLRVSQYDIVKTLFLADKSHLNTYGRPIIFDNYVAMRDGPVPSVAYNLLKEHAPTLRKYKLKKLPWTRQGPDVGSGRCYYSKAPKQHNDDILSDSDIEALGSALTTVKSLTFGQVRALTHADPAYTEAWKTDGARKSFPMSYGMLFDSPDFETAEVVELLSKRK